ncbi:transglutaminase-like domain-containing protein [Xylocopilactobacillus apicola]|uniref:Transglutaminase-like domain-containing protein n=1 Tax=Xylocopilactobacillus apicola TaxID=2932184 RepID=A0AAU9DVN0_9LACO|nr:transglutaminase-like domain-containing protein [Xylocopilactobacillus apicola]BDR57918.1 hypothetical protein XA3_03590 [Xylocopilactobacillus apicola]
MKIKKNALALFFLAILNVVIVAAAVPGFVDINLPDTKAIVLKKILFIDFYLFIVAMAFYLGAKKRRWWGFVSWIFGFVSQLFLLFLLFPSQAGHNWFKVFGAEVSRELSSLWGFNFVVMPTVLATIIVLFFATLILGFGIYCDLWYITFPLVLTYILSITVFDSHDHWVAAIVILLCFALQIFMVTNYQEIFVSKKPHLGLLVLAFLVLAISLGGGIIFRKTFVNLTKVVDGPGVRVRNKLNTLGFYQTINEQTQNNPEARKAGFSINSRELGGPMLDNNRLVYTVWEKQPNYLRIDTKHNYSGRGFNDNETLGSELSGRTLLLDEVKLPTKGTRSSIKIIYSNTMKAAVNQFIPQVYGKISIDFGSQKINSATHNMENSLLQYDNSKSRTSQFSYEVNYYDVSNDNIKKNTGGEIPEDVQKMYTQLPKKLPSRVNELAQQVTKSKDNQLDKVLALQNYLKTNSRFTYSRLEAQRTPAGHDFVDYFLFDHPVGYCDNFATSMVVMLRTLGIPARYAEGFSPGTSKQKIGDNYEYEIRNNNAHSWPEVYFAQIGWVPFEPTPGFRGRGKDSDNSSSVDDLTAKGSSQTSSGSNSSETSSSSGSTSSSTSKSTKSSTSSLSKKSAPKTPPHKPNPFLPWILSIMALVLIVALFIFRQTFYWLFLGIVFAGGRWPEKCYLTILRYFEGRLKRESDEPLAQYAKRVGILYPQINDLFIKSTHQYEVKIYGNEAESSELGSVLHELIITMMKNPRSLSS